MHIVNNTVTRDRVIESAIYCFARAGYFGTKVDGIAKHGHFNKAMIYYFYKSKEKLYIDIIKQIYINLITNIRSIGVVLSTDEMLYFIYLRIYMCKIMLFFKINPDFLVIISNAMITRNTEIYTVIKEINETNSDNISSVLLNYFEFGKAHGFINDIDTKVLLRIILGIISIHFFTTYYDEFNIYKNQEEDVSITPADEKMVESMINAIKVSKSSGKNVLKSKKD